MSSNLPDNSAARVSIKELEQQALQESFHDRQQAKQLRCNGPRRWRRKSAGTVSVAIRNLPDLITQIADEQEKHLGEVVEDAVRLLHRSLKSS
jgi:hypothetical protein